MRGTVVAVDAVHAVLRSIRDLLAGERGVLRIIFRHMPLQVFHVDISNHLSFNISRNISNFVGNVHVPMNAFGRAGGWISAASLDQHADLSRRVLFVAGVVGEDFELRSIKFPGPMALLTSLLRRTQIVDRRLNRARIGVEDRLVYLARAR